MFEHSKSAELLEASIRIEDNGQAFYREVAQKLKDPKVSELFEYLAAEETRHMGIFSEMLQKNGNYEPMDKCYPGEYHAFLKTFSDNHVFNKLNAGRSLAARMNSPDEILNFAMRIELEFTFFYMEVRHHVHKPHAEIISRLFVEEQSHYLKLIQLQTAIG
jgi:rubrerythrin